MSTAETDEPDPRQPEATDDVGVQEGEAPPPEEDVARNPPEELDKLRGG